MDTRSLAFPTIPSDPTKTEARFQLGYGSFDAGKLNNTTPKTTSTAAPKIKLTTERLFCRSRFKPAKFWLDVGRSTLTFEFKIVVLTFVFATFLILWAEG